MANNGEVEENEEVVIARQTDFKEAAGHEVRNAQTTVEPTADYVVEKIVGKF